MEVSSLNIDGDAVTRTAAELNILDGVTVTKDNIINHLSNLTYQNVKAALDDRYTKSQVDSVIANSAGGNIVTVGALNSEVLQVVLVILTLVQVQLGIRQDNWWRVKR